MRAKEKLGKTVTIRSTPVGHDNDTGADVLPYATVEYTAIVDDLEHPGDASYKWLQIGAARFVNYWYPPNGERFTLVDEPPPPSTSEIDHVDVVFKDGSVVRCDPA